MTPTVDSEFAALVPRLTDAERDGLEDDIVRDGRAIVPLVVWGDVLLDGHNRLSICTEHELPYDTRQAPACVVDRSTAIEWILRTALNRRSLTPRDRAKLGAAIAAELKARAKARQREGKGVDGSGGRGNKKNLPANLPEGFDERPPSERETRTQAAEAAGMSPKTFAAAVRVNEHACPELQAAVDAGRCGMDTAAKLTKLPVERQMKLAAQGKKACKAAAGSVDREVATRNRVANGEALPAIVEALDAEIITVNEAYRVSKFPPDRQPNELEKCTRNAVEAKPAAEKLDLPDYQKHVDALAGIGAGITHHVNEIAKHDVDAALSALEKLRKLLNQAKKGITT